jgi:hypothetical protein
VNVITAFEGYEITYKKSKEWHNDSMLMSIGSMGKHDENGKASKWYYEYYSPFTSIEENNVTKYEIIFIFINYKFELSNITDYLVIDEIGEPIINWSIDSDQAVAIAKRDNKIKSFLSKYENSEIGLNLRMEKKYSNNPIWSIGWSDQGWMDNPHNARIIIDAKYGNILKVETQM